MRLVPLVFLLAANLEGQAPAWGEVRVGAGVFCLFGGPDLHVQARLGQSPWMWGYRYVQYTDISRDPFTDRKLTETEQTMVGPTVAYLFRPQALGTWVLGGAVLRWSRREKAFFTGEIDRASTTGVFVGGGYMWSWKVFYCQLGLYLSPGTRLKTSTSVSSEESSGAFDIHIQVGCRF
jgi:hypothetical protein